MRAIQGLHSALRSYFTSWLVWVVAMVYFLCLGFGISEGLWPKSIAQAMPGNWFGTSLENLPANLDTVSSIVIGPEFLIDPAERRPSRDLSETRLAQIREHYVFRPGSPFRGPGRLPHLNHLVIFGSVDGRQLVDLLEFVRIESLTLGYLHSMTNESWTALAKQPLKRLEILSMDRTPGPQTPWPPTLQTLLLQGSLPPKQDQEPSAWASLAGLENLRILRVSLWPNAQGTLLEADLELLDRLPSLQSLYLDPFPYDTIQGIQARLPEVAIRPAFYQRNRVNGAHLIAFASIFPLCLLLHMLTNQFHSPASLLTPGFARAHLGIAALVMIGIAILQTGALVWIGCEWTASIAAGLIGVFLLYGCTLLANQQRRFPGFLYLHHLIFPIMASVICFLFLSLFVPAPLDWFLQGYQPQWAIALVIIEAFCCAELARFFSLLPRKLAENADGSLPLGMFKPFFEEGLLRKEHGTSQGNRFWSWMQEGRLRAALASTQDPPRKRVLLWRAGNSMSPGVFLLFFYFIILGVGGLLFALSVFLYPGMQQHFTLYTIWPAAFQPLFMGLFLPGMLLFQRRPYLAQDLLMANSRKSWVTLVFRETALAFYPVLGAMVVALITYTNWKPPGGWPALDLGLLGLGIIGLVLAATLFLVTLKPWSQLALVLGVLAFLMCAPFALAGLGPNDFLEVQSLLAWPPFHWMWTWTLAAIGLVLAYWRWLHWEVG